MSQTNRAKEEKIRKKFKVFISREKDYYEKANLLDSVLVEKGFRTNVVANNSQGSFISNDLKDMIRSSICFVTILTSNFLNSSLINQEIGYAQGKGLKVILLINTTLKDKLQDFDTKLTVMEFNEDDFKQTCFSVTDQIIKITEILDESIDLESFLEFYTKSNKIYHEP